MESGEKSKKKLDKQNSSEIKTVSLESGYEKYLDVFM